MSDPRSSHFGQMRHETLPADHLFGRRVELLTLAVLSQLEASANWHRIAREWMYGDDAGDGARRATEKPRFYGRPESAAGSSCPGLPGRQAGGDADALALLDPAELDDARDGGGDQLLGDLVAAHRRRLHAPHQPAAADGLAAGRERVDRHGRPVRGDQPRRAAAQRRAHERGEAELVRGAAWRCRRACRRGRGGRGARGARSTRGTARSAPCARRSTPASPPPRPGTGRPRSPARASPRRCRRGSRSRRRSPRRASGATSATIESSICVAVIDGRASAPASAITCFWTIGTSSIRISIPRSPRATITQSAARTISSARCTACGFSILAISGSRVCLRRNVMSSARRTNDSATRSTPICSPVAHVLEVLLGHRRQRGRLARDVEALARGDRAADLDLGVDLAVARARRRSRAAGRRRRPGR